MAIFREIIASAKADPLWGVAFGCVVLLPLMLVFSRAGMEIGCAVTGLLFLWRSYRRKEWDWLRDPFLKLCIVAWLWLVLVVTPLALDPVLSLPDALAWFRLPLFFAALRYWVLVRRDSLYALAVAVALMLALVVLDTLWQAFTGMSISGTETLETGRLTGPFSSPKVGIFIAKLLLPVVAILLVCGTHTRRAHMVVVALLLGCLAAIILSGERSAFLGALLGGAVTMVLLALRDRKLRVPCMLITLVCAVLSMGLYVTSPWVQKRAHQTVASISHYPESQYGLLVLTGIDIGMAHPVHGVGLGSFRKLCPVLGVGEYQFRGMHPHNAFIEWFSEAGVVGLGLFVSMLVLLWFLAARTYRQAAAAERLLPAMALGVLMQHFFPLMGMHSFFSNWSAVLMWFSLGLIFAAMPRPAR